MAREPDHDDVERQLRGYFDAQREELRAPADLWTRVSGQLGGQSSSPWWRLIDVGAWLRTVQPVYAGAAAVIAVAVVGIATYTALSGDSASDGTVTTAAVVESQAVGAPEAAPAAPEARLLDAPVGDDASAPTVASATPAPMTSLAAEPPVESTDPSIAMSFASPEVFLEPLIDVMLSGQRLFSVSLPPGWAVGGPRAAATGWEGTFAGGGVLLVYQGGTAVLSDIGDVLGSARDRHVITEETIGGYAAQLVQPIGDEEGVTAMLLDLPGGRLLVIGQALNAEQQRVAFAIFRSIEG